MTKKVVKNLATILANSYSLALKTQNYHWNVTGQNFKPLHELFGAQYEELFEAIDELAERIRALESFVDGSFEAFLQLSQIKSAQQNISANQMLKDLAHDHNLLVKLLKEAIVVAQEDKDEATADMFIERVQIHEKALWMIRASS